jgi:hypothetical protein
VAQILTSSSIDGVHHQHLSINLINLDLFIVQMLAAGTPDATSGLNANTFRLTWNMMTSASGVNFLRRPGRS